MQSTREKLEERDRDERDYPAYFWEVSKTDAVRTWRLYRETKTQKRILRSNVELIDADALREAGIDDLSRHGEWNSVYPTQSFGDRRYLRKPFTDAVAGLFIRAINARNWNLDPLFSNLVWYEEQFIEDLRYLRNAVNRGNPLPEEEIRKLYDDDPERLKAALERRAETVEKYGETAPEFPDEINEFVKHCRSSFTLTDSRAVRTSGDGGVHPDPGEKTDLSEFGGDSA
jgi:hypothetical protein